MNELPPLSQLCPIMYSTIGGDSGLGALIMERLPPPPPWSSPMIAASRVPEEVSNCCTSACNMAPVSRKLEELPVQMEQVQLENKGGSSESILNPKDLPGPVRQVAVGKRKPSQTALPTPLRQVSSSSDAVQEVEEGEVKANKLRSVPTDTSDESENPHGILAGPLRVRRFTFSRRSTSQSLSLKSTPAFSIMRSAMSSISSPPALFRPPSVDNIESKDHPGLHDRQRSSPSTTGSTADPFNRPRFQTWPGSYNPVQETRCPPQGDTSPNPSLSRISVNVCKEGEMRDASGSEEEIEERIVISHFSDSSEDEEEEKWKSSWKPPVKRRFRGRLSEMIYRP